MYCAYLRSPGGLNYVYFKCLGGLGRLNYAYVLCDGARFALLFCTTVHTLGAVCRPTLALDRGVVV